MEYGTRRKVESYDFEYVQSHLNYSNEQLIEGIYSYKGYRYSENTIEKLRDPQGKYATKFGYNLKNYSRNKVEPSYNNETAYIPPQKNIRPYFEQNHNGNGKNKINYQQQTNNKIKNDHDLSVMLIGAIGFPLIMWILLHVGFINKITIIVAQLLFVVAIYYLVTGLKNGKNNKNLNIAGSLFCIAIGLSSLCAKELFVGIIFFALGIWIEERTNY